MESSKSGYDICFSTEEALSLLELIVTSAGEMTPEQRSVVMKLSEYCRMALRDRTDHAISAGLSNTAAA